MFGAPGYRPPPFATKADQDDYRIRAQRRRTMQDRWAFAHTVTIAAFILIFAVVIIPIAFRY